MKKQIQTWMLIAFLGTAFTATAQEKVITVNQLPKTAQSFISSHYAKSPVSLVKSEKETLSPLEYKVVLQDGTEIEFDEKGNWTEIDGKRNAVPTAIIPAAIKAHVNKSFPNNEIVELKKKKKGYEVELTSGIDLKFDAKGKFLKIDD
ncbi:PepSY-like domain-containing protein [Sphingobacterium kyonggiense]|uniref:PepSY-like domain-containing protein n=1 Tax=Sphingobacterium kyonggiense TaxID=714075 RepID=A0ABP7YML3_9SPHI